VAFQLKVSRRELGLPALPRSDCGGVVEEAVFFFLLGQLGEAEPPCPSPLRRKTSCAPVSLPTSTKHVLRDEKDVVDGGADRCHWRVGRF
jgi:hypothetical protein